MQAARLVLGIGLADSIRRDMGDHWLAATLAAHLDEARAQGEWSFAHSTLQAWLDHRHDRLDEGEYRRRLAKCVKAGIRQFIPRGMGGKGGRDESLPSRSLEMEVM